MRFLKALFWVIIGSVLAWFVYANLDEVVTFEPLKGTFVDVKLPVLLIATFLLGFLPTFLILRARIWGLKRRLEAQATMYVANTPDAGLRRAAPAPVEAPAAESRTATDARAWPTE